VRSMERRRRDCIEIGYIEIGYIEMGSMRTVVGIAHVKAIEALHRPMIAVTVLHQAGRF
jgi:hypothetical protein